ncbi:phosphohexomutase domain-containing protein [Puniceicoccus vermicola]|uniref:Phosphoglucosamine mutase n=1 Tax=Puniceicoccus vermicola TaxID=388746 RepID=A0A7X1E3C4_9BACT|nr:phosphoglucosamine mutase [Puniceicoccus vermicola]MBC2600921.1 phosphoglucosamine mutase [Puniceicoccus vermicola]
MSTRYFGTDGIRGPADGPLFEKAFLLKFSDGLIRYLRSSLAVKSPRIVIGRDTRETGSRIVEDLIEGFSRIPGECIDLGIVPTPAVANSVRVTEADLGIAITASHNPAEDNGIKLFSAEGTKFPETEEEKIEAFMLAPTEIPMGENADFSKTKRNGLASYLQASEILSVHLNLEDTTIVCDTANGATCESTPSILTSRGANLILTGNNPDGTNINLDCGSEHAEKLAKMVQESGATLGIAHDGDGDRVIFVDEKGSIVPGDQILGIFALHSMSKGSLVENTLVTTIQSNRGLDLAIQKAGGKVVRTDVGDRNVAFRMREIGASLGGESSGHIILHNYSTTGDGLLAALYLLRVLKETGKPLSQLRKEVPLLPQMTGNLRVKEKHPLSTCKTLIAEQAAIESTIGQSGRVMLRYSGTEPKLRFLVEAPMIEDCEAYMKRLLTAARTDLGEA